MEIAGDDLLEVAVFYLAFPYGNDTPPRLCQNLIISPVSFDIFLQLGDPVFNIARWNCRSFTTRMLMPETSPYLNNQIMLFEYNIRLTGQPWIAKPETKSISM